MSPTRRTILAGALPVVAGLSGCASGDDPNESEADVAGTERDPAVRAPRNVDGGPVVTGDDGTGRLLIADESSAERVEFGDGVPDADVESTRAFLAETAFDEETVYVTERTVDSCNRFRLQSVSWEPGRIDFEQCTELRPTDEPCEAGASERVALFVRIPAVLEQEITSGGRRDRPCRATDTDWKTVGNETADGDSDESGVGNDTANGDADDGATDGGAGE